MSEAWAHDGVTAGTLLRRAREAAGLHVAALAVSLKVPVRKLEALEADRYDLLTDAVFTRALASSVCRTLKIDPHPVLERLPQTAAPRLVQNNEGLNTPFHAPSDGASPAWIDQLSRPVFLAVFALLLGALVLILLPTAQTGDGAATVAGTEVTNSPLPPAPAETVTAAVSPDASPRAGVVPAPAPVATAVSVPGPVSTVATGPTLPTTGIVVLRANGSSWVEVTDAKGVVAVRRLLEAGEAVGASGALPLQVTIGRVDVTEVQVRGKPFDLRPVSKDNVARFEVK